MVLIFFFVYGHFESYKHRIRMISTGNGIVKEIDKKLSVTAGRQHFFCKGVLLNSDNASISVLATMALSIDNSQPSICAHGPELKISHVGTTRGGGQSFIVIFEFSV